MSRHNYTQAEDNWIISNWDAYKTYGEVLKAFNDKFECELSDSSFTQHTRKSLKLPTKGNSRYTAYSDAEKAFITEQYFKCDTYKELVDKVNAEFNNNRTVNQMRDYCIKRLNLSSNKMKNMTRFGDNRYKEHLPIGTIKKASMGTYIKVKMAVDGTCYSGYAEPYWLPLQKKIYQDAYGEIKNNQMVCFLDGNRDNFELDNLYVIDRSISACMSKHRWWTDSKEHTLTAIKWCELWYAMKNAKEVMVV